MAEEFRDDRKLMIVADVPGLRPDEDIAISITRDVLHIRAGRDDLRVEGTDLREGVFSRDIRLPAGTDTRDVRAHYVDGVLEVEAPMRIPDGLTRVVPVTTAPTGAGSPIA